MVMMWCAHSRSFPFPSPLFVFLPPGFCIFSLLLSRLRSNAQQPRKERKTVRQDTDTACHSCPVAIHIAHFPLAIAGHHSSRQLRLTLNEAGCALICDVRRKLQRRECTRCQGTTIALAGWRHKIPFQGKSDRMMGATTLIVHLHRAERATGQIDQKRTYSLENEERNERREN